MVDAVLQAIRAQGVVAIVRAADPDSAARNVELLIHAGLRVVEVSLVTPQALDVIREAAENAPAGVHIGVGTAVTAEEVRLAAAAGASFVVSPALREEVVATSLELGLLTLPGITTPTEALQAIEWGATVVKIFPASLWSPAILREVRAALPDLATVPTGGVTLESAPEWIRAGALAVGIGSSLTTASHPGSVARLLMLAIEAART